MNPVLQHMARGGTSHVLAVNQQLNVIGSGGAEQSMNSQNNLPHKELLRGESGALAGQNQTQKYMVNSPCGKLATRAHNDKKGKRVGAN